MEPDVGRSSPAMRPSKVDFPLPDGTDDGHALLIGNLKCEIVEDRDLMATTGQAHCQMRDGNHVSV